MSCLISDLVGSIYKAFSLDHSVLAETTPTRMCSLLIREMGWRPMGMGENNQSRFSKQSSKCSDKKIKKTLLQALYHWFWWGGGLKGRHRITIKYKLLCCLGYSFLFCSCNFPIFITSNATDFLLHTLNRQTCPSFLIKPFPLDVSLCFLWIKVGRRAASRTDTISCPSSH